MDNKMLIDATHPEETRVVVVRGNRVEEFDFEAENKKQLKGNIYLAKVTRVEPSLQAAFVDYGGNRHGFLAFSEIHPDYYQIPMADRKALLEAEAEANKEQQEDEDAPKPAKKRSSRKKTTSKAAESEKDPVVQSDVVKPEEAEAEDTVSAEEAKDDTPAPNTDGETDTTTDTPVDEPVEIKAAEASEENETSSGTETEEAAQSSDEIEGKEEQQNDDKEVEAEAKNSEDGEKPAKKGRRRTRKKKDANAETDGQSDDDETNEEDSVESIGSEDALEEVPERKSRPRIKQYKIQEVIKRRQIILVQVVKEERGNKGAALTTYLSLAGRYSVLMPNTDRGGGISRKITNQSDRKRLRAIASDLDVAEGMGVILRTAGASRTKTEIKRDFEYLMRLWENVRDLTLQSSAPTLVYEEGSLLKRSIRDLYNKDIKQVLVSGDEGYREAKDFMRMLMPSHAKNVQPYKDLQPIFARYNVETQLDAMFSPQVTLKSGGYIVINQTEALVSIDVNSGRSTRESSIEETALSTNLETAEEVARQLRLRDLAGLIVIDFIDMEEKKNNRAVERKLKECLANDRARIQVGRISHFGLLEMSRQRLRAGVLESTMEICPHCQGTGYVRAPASVALYVLRSIEDYLYKGSKFNLVVRTQSAVALYVLNHKRANLTELENRFGISILIEADETLAGEYCTISRGERAEAPRMPTMVTPETVDIDAELARDAELDAEAEALEQQQIAEEDRPLRKRRRRRERGSRSNSESETNGESQAQDAQAEGDSDEGEEAPRKRRRRRGRRGGRRERERNTRVENEQAASADDIQKDANVLSDQEAHADGLEADTQNAAPSEDTPTAEENTAGSKADEDLKAKASRPKKKVKKEAEAAPATDEGQAEADGEKKPARGGWWQRRTFF